ncbi:hypothetical protein G6N76_09425 [Rhizobium daejeonense]|uniref:Phosphodiester glycosidase domain-containing protein n=2 Tax=Rhizobium daejeonense TaxID=240521 RepID=A0A6M1RYE8_9HYPH|nr:phosphodiester glycosidase family protein [Rhizobium daejeonense]NGO63895.1 hypothetical protein [Rhizobium daejeonense]
MRLLFLLFSIFLSACSISHATETDPCRELVQDGVRYTVCSFEPDATLRIYHSDPARMPFGNFDSLSLQLWKERHYPVFAMNGGMYHYDLSPVGLFVENGIERQPISTRAGWGNFHLLPNGVFYVAGGKPGVMETQAYIREKPKADYATQSGPMLVIDGKLHPRFLPDSDSLKIRNGVGVDAEGRVHFAISRGPVNFYAFASLFRDELGCGNALYLDGTISSALIPSMGRRDRFFPLGPIIAVIGTIPQ